jgi:hypothetical protein
VSDFQVIQRELALYPTDAELGSMPLSGRPQIVVATKLDALDEPARLDALRAHVESEGLPFLAISSVTGDGVQALLEAAWPHVAARQEEDRPPARPRRMPVSSGDAGGHERDHLDPDRDDAADGFDPAGRAGDNGPNDSGADVDEDDPDAGDADETSGR